MLTCKIRTIIFQIENNWQNAEMRLHNCTVYRPPYFSGIAQRSAYVPTAPL